MTYVLHGFYGYLYPVCIQSLYSPSPYEAVYTDTINSLHQSLHTTNANKSSIAEIPALSLSFFSADATILFSLAAVRVGLAGGCWTDRASFPSFLVFSSFLPSFLLQPHLFHLSSISLHLSSISLPSLSISLPSLFHLSSISLPSLSSSPSLLHLFSFRFFSSSFVGSSPSYKQPFFVISRSVRPIFVLPFPAFASLSFFLSHPIRSFFFPSCLVVLLVRHGSFVLHVLKKLHLSPSFFFLLSSCSSYSDAFCLPTPP